MFYTYILFDILILAAFKIIKNLLPEKAIEILKVITKKDINNYIERSCCLTSWGGTDNYKFQFVPEKRIELSPNLLSKNNDNSKQKV